MTAQKSPAEIAAAEADAPAEAFKEVHYELDGAHAVAGSPADVVRLEFDGWRKAEKSTKS